MVSCLTWSGVLDSSDLYLSFFITSPASHITIILISPSQTPKNLQKSKNLLNRYMNSNLGIRLQGIEFLSAILEYVQTEADYQSQIILEQIHQIQGQRSINSPNSNSNANANSSSHASPVQGDVVWGGDRSDRARVNSPTQRQRTYPITNSAVTHTNTQTIGQGGDVGDSGSSGNSGRAQEAVVDSVHQLLLHGAGTSSHIKSI